MLGRALGPGPAGIRRHFHVLMTHYHFDHVEGLPFFPPLYDPNSRFTFHGFEPAGRSLRESLEQLMQPPWFPVELAKAPAGIEYAPVLPGPLSFSGITATWLPLNHPGGAIAWRLELEGRRIVLATDHEHGDYEKDRALVRFAAGADLLIHDAAYEVADYEARRRGWGHSTWQAAAILARSAAVKTLMLFHHEPDHSDEELERLLGLARGLFPSTMLAREGMEYCVAPGTVRLAGALRQVAESS